MNQTSSRRCREHGANLGCEGIEGEWHGGVSCLLEGGRSFIAKLITDEEFYLPVGVMIHESFAKDVKEYDLLSTLFSSAASPSFTFVVPSPPRKIG